MDVTLQPMTSQSIQVTWKVCGDGALGSPWPPPLVGLWDFPSQLRGQLLRRHKTRGPGTQLSHITC